jgi:hypothetical protein
LHCYPVGTMNIPTPKPDDDDAGSVKQGRTLQIKPVSMGYNPELNYDSVESLIEYGEGVLHR